MKPQSIVCICAALCAPVPLAAAQALTARDSTLNYNYVYGAGADTHTGGDSRTRVTLLTSDADEMHFLGSTSGVLPGDQPYSAGVSLDLNQEYAITGSVQEMQSITAHASTMVSAGTNGLGSAAMHAANPGNQIVLSFTVQTAIPFHLSGSVTLSNPSPFSFVALQRFNGFNWDYVFYSAFLPNGQGPFDRVGTLVPGDYRITGALAVSAGANQAFSGAYDYVLDVPGLGTCIADFNADGGTDGADVESFFADWESGNAHADVNADGGIDGADVEFFFEHWEAGC